MRMVMTSPRPFEPAIAAKFAAMRRRLWGMRGASGEAVMATDALSTVVTFAPAGADRSSASPALGWWRTCNCVGTREARPRIRAAAIARTLGDAPGTERDQSVTGGAAGGACQSRRGPIT